MPVNNIWLIENRVLLTELIGDVSSDELVANSKLGTEMIESGTAPVYSLVDFSHMTHYPMSLGELNSLFRQPSSKKLSWMILCGIPNPFANFIATTFAQIIRSGYKVVKTREEALRLIDEIEGNAIGG